MVDWHCQIVNKGLTPQQIGLARDAGQSGWTEIGLKIFLAFHCKYFCANWEIFLWSNIRLLFCILAHWVRNISLKPNVTSLPFYYLSDRSFLLTELWIGKGGWEEGTQVPQLYCTKVEVEELEGQNQNQTPTFLLPKQLCSVSLSHLLITDSWCEMGP